MILNVVSVLVFIVIAGIGIVLTAAPDRRGGPRRSSAFSRPSPLVSRSSGNAPSFSGSGASSVCAGQGCSGSSLSWTSSPARSTSA